MARFNAYIDELMKHEGGWSDHEFDPGNETKYGITLATWRAFGHDKDNDGDIDAEDLAVITKDDAQSIYKPKYWDKIKGDSIHSQDVANIIFDHAVNAGVKRASKMAQAVLKVEFHKNNLTVDGIIGPKTVAEINSVNAAQFHDEFKRLRKDYYNYLANRLDRVRSYVIPFLKTLGIRPNSNFRAFINGWLNRVDSFLNLFKKKSVGIGSFFILSGLGYLAWKRYQKIKAA